MRRRRPGQGPRPRQRGLFVELPDEIHALVSQLGERLNLSNRDLVIAALRNLDVVSSLPESRLDEVMAKLAAKPDVDYGDVEIDPALLSALSEGS